MRDFVCANNLVCPTGCDHRIGVAICNWTLVVGVAAIKNSAAGHEQTDSGNYDSFFEFLVHIFSPDYYSSYAL